MPRISVVVPVRDGARHLPALLDSLATQDWPVELVAIDSGSGDSSRELLERAGARLLRVARDEFDHGATRNLGVRAASGEIVAFLSQDAVPQGPSFVRTLCAGVARDARLAGAFARQVPRPEADPLTRRDLGAWVAAEEKPRVVFAGPGELEALAPLERLRRAAFDNVASAARRALLLEQPFLPSRFGEDIEWGLRLLHLGYGLAYVPEAVVVHSHARDTRALLRRHYLCHRALRRLHGLAVVPSLPRFLLAALGATARDVGTLLRARAGAAELLAAPAQAVAATYGMYRGARDEARGRPYPAWA